jgi:hypothetical protein
MQFTNLDIVDRKDLAWNGHKFLAVNSLSKIKKKNKKKNKIKKKKKKKKKKSNTFAAAVTACF